ncbi:MAG: class II glutamine amidotransferase, partial [Candidatus Paceibacterota bacterium]
MCGIIAYKGKENAVQIVMDGLRHLEYRGYDSAGLCVVSKNKTFLIKKTGKVENLLREVKKKQAHDEMLEGEIGIGHSRWATHGSVTEANAHPHFSCDQKIFVVHNGIVENYESLKEELVKKGHRFVSETDTEVIPHLIEEYRKKYSFVISCEKTFNRLDG